jgi:protoporphyrinogen oxidase
MWESQAMAKRVLILGAGVCGLAAAWRLLQNDPSTEVTLLEGEPTPGGLARSLTIDGQVTDLGPHRIFTELPDVQDFLEDLAGGELEKVTRKSRMWLRGGWIEYPPKPLEVAAHLGVGTLAGAGVSYLGEKAGSLLRGAEGPESFESLMRAGFGPELYRMLVAPYAEKVWKIHPSQIHADIARVRVSAGGLDQMVKRLLVGEKEGQLTAVKRFYYLRGGVETLVRKLVKGVEERGGKLLLNRRVQDLRSFKTGHWRAIVGGPDGPENHDADVVISTIPLQDLMALLLGRNPNPEAAARSGELRSISNFLVGAVLPTARINESQWLYFPGRDTVFNRAYEPKNFHSSMGTKDRSMMVFETTCHPGDATDRRSDRALLAATLKGAERVGLFAAKDVVAHFVHRIPNTYPLYDLDYRERLSTLWRYLEQFPTLVSCGRQGLFLHNNMDHSIHMGFRAAERMAEGTDDLARRFYSEVRRFQQFRIVD